MVDEHVEVIIAIVESGETLQRHLRKLMEALDKFVLHKSDRETQVYRCGKHKPKQSPKKAVFCKKRWVWLKNTEFS